MHTKFYEGMEIVFKAMDPYTKKFPSLEVLIIILVETQIHKEYLPH